MDKEEGEGNKMSYKGERREEERSESRERKRKQRRAEMDKALKER